MIKVKTLPWPAVGAFYAELEEKHRWDIAPMRALISFLARPPYGNGLFPYTSHAELCLGRVLDFLPGDAELRVEFDPRKQRFEFTYLPSPGTKPWRGQYAALGFETYLESLLQKRLRWFTPATD